MATPPPPPPPREPSFLPRPTKPSPWVLVLKIALGIVAGVVVLFVIGVGLLAAACGGLFG